MKYFLIVIILGLCGGGYYEYTEIQRVQQDKVAADQKQITDLSTKVDKLQSDNKALEDDKTQLTKGADDAQAKIADLTKQVQTAQDALADAKKQLLAAQAAAKPPSVAAPPRPTNNLGTITTLDGKTFQNCLLLKFEADGIVVNHSEGITKIMYGLLPPEMQQKFGYDPHQTTELTEQQVQVLEEKREAAAKGAGK